MIEEKYDQREIMDSGNRRGVGNRKIEDEKEDEQSQAKDDNEIRTTRKG